jgi:hypothetical protein
MRGTMESRLSPIFTRGLPSVWTCLLVSLSSAVYLPLYSKIGIDLAV